MDSVAGCTTMRMYLMSLNCTLKMIKMVNFMLCIFYHKKKYFSNTYHAHDTQILPTEFW